MYEYSQGDWDALEYYPRTEAGKAILGNDVDMLYIQSSLSPVQPKFVFETDLCSFSETVQSTGLDTGSSAIDVRIVDSHVQSAITGVEFPSKLDDSYLVKGSPFYSARFDFRSILSGVDSATTANLNGHNYVDIMNNNFLDGLYRRLTVAKMAERLPQRGMLSSVLGPVVGYSDPLPLLMADHHIRRNPGSVEDFKSTAGDRIRITPAGPDAITLVQQYVGTPEN